MKKIVMGILLFTIALTFFSCDNGLFGTNLFAKLDKYKKPDINNATCRDLIKAGGDPRFAGSLNDEEVEKVNNKLKETYSDTSASDKDRAEAALLAGDVQFGAHGVNDSLKKINDIFLNVISDEPDDADLDNLLETFFDDESKETIAEKIDALLESANAYYAYGEIVDDVNVDENPGDTAIKAVMSCMVAEIMELNPSLTSAELAGYIIDENVEEGLNTPTYTEGASFKQNLTEALGNDDKARNIVKVVQAGFDISKIDLD